MNIITQSSIKKLGDNLFDDKEELVIFCSDYIKMKNPQWSWSIYGEHKESKRVRV